MIRINMYYGVIFLIVQLYKITTSIVLFYYTPCAFKLGNIYPEIQGTYVVIPSIYLVATLLFWVILYKLKDIWYSLTYMLKESVYVEALFVLYMISTFFVLLSTFISNNNVIGVLPLLPIIIFELLSIPLLDFNRMYFKTIH